MDIIGFREPGFSSPQAISSESVTTAILAWCWVHSVEDLYRVDTTNNKQLDEKRREARASYEEEATQLKVEIALTRQASRPTFLPSSEAMR